MIRNCKVGTKVRIIQRHPGSEESYDKGVKIASFDLKVGDTGVVARVLSLHRRYLVVKVDPPNFGEIWLRPSEVFHV